MLKKDSIKLDRDAFLDKYYISFDYFSMNKFNIKIFLNATEHNPILGDDNLENKFDDKLNPEKNNLKFDLLKENLIDDDKYHVDYKNSKIKYKHFKK